MPKPFFKKEKTNLCSNCKGVNDRLPQPYCTVCHALKMKEWRAKRSIQIKTALEFYKLHHGQ